jgi:2-oxoglutarate ferredoxin oxidoreductase subunit beta
MHDLHEAKLEVVQLGEGVGEEDLLIHDERDRGLAFLLAQMSHPDFPEAMGVLYRDPEHEPYEALMAQQVEDARQTQGVPDLAALLHEGDTWMVD